MTNGGGKANKSGGGLEHYIRDTVTRWFNSKTMTHQEWAKLPVRPALVTNVPFTTVYGTRGRSEFVLFLADTDIRIECKWQAVSGSVDEKFPYLLECMKGVPEPAVVIVVDGGGAKPSAVEWLKKAALAHSTKTILVMSMAQFGTWAQNYYRQRG